VVLRQGAITDAAELTEFARTSLAGYKVPRDIRFIDEIPRSTAAKTLRRVLADRAARLREAERDADAGHAATEEARS
jgi:fatty-acyl-CoA synthase